MWQRFTERARKVVFYAQEESIRLGLGEVRPEHLMLGLLREPDGTGARILESLGVRSSVLWQAIDDATPRGKDPGGKRDMTLAPAAKRVIDLTYEEAKALDNAFIGTEHLLLGLMRLGDGPWVDIFKQAKVTLEAVRGEVIAMQAAEGKRSNEFVVAGSTREAIAGFDSATEESKQYGDGLVATEHHLLAILKDANSAGRKALVEIGVDVDGLIAATMERVAVKAAPPGAKGLRSPRLRRAYVLASDERRRLRSKKLNSVHVLLGLLGEGGGVAAQALKAAGVEAEPLRKIAKRRIKE